MTVERDPGTVEYELHHAIQVLPPNVLENATGASIKALYAYSEPHKNTRRMPAVMAPRIDAALERFGHAPVFLPLLESIHKATLQRLGGPIKSGFRMVMPGLSRIAHAMADYAGCLERVMADGQINRADLDDLRDAYKQLSDLEITVRQKRQRVFDMIAALEDCEPIDRKAS